MIEINKCNQCGEYTSEIICKCGGKAITPKPAKFNPDDKYSKYRLKYKQNELENKGN